VPVGHPFFGRLSECECKRREKEVRRAADLRRLSNLEAFLEAYDFDAFDPSVEGTEEAYREAVAYARDPTGRWLLLHGNCGAGKTHLAAAIALRVMEQGKSVYFAVVPDLLDHLRSTFDPNSGVAYDQRFDDIRNAWLLVLDDLGTENTTPWAREKLYQIFNHRYNERLPTIVTSNRDHHELDERVVSRLLDRNLTRDVVIDAEDYRRRGRPDYVQGRGRSRSGRGGKTNWA